MKILTTEDINKIQGLLSELPIKYIAVAQNIADVINTSQEYKPEEVENEPEGG